MRSNNLFLLSLLLYTDLAPALPIDHATRALLSYHDGIKFTKREPVPGLDSEDAERMYVSYFSLLRHVQLQYKCHNSQYNGR